MKSLIQICPKCDKATALRSDTGELICYDSGCYEERDFFLSSDSESGEIRHGNLEKLVGAGKELWDNDEDFENFVKEVREANRGMSDLKTTGG